MKHIKFRAFATGVNVMTFFDNVIVATGELSEGKAWGMFFPSVNGKVYLGGYSEPMQFTGLCDKNGKEIYEGDIVDIHNHGRFEVGYSIGAFNIKRIFGEREPLPKWKLKGESRTFNLATYTDVIDLQNPRMGLYTVIGNIYENPELLGGAA